jgi:hypothetical protein
MASISMESGRQRLVANLDGTFAVLYFLHVSPEIRLKRFSAEADAKAWMEILRDQETSKKPRRGEPGGA